MSTTGMLWQLMFTATPRQVFGALVATASAHGRLLSVEDYGTVLVFSPSRSALHRCAPIRATVSSSEQGTLLSFSPTLVGREVEDTAAQAASVGSLIHQLRRRVEPAAA